MVVSTVDLRRKEQEEIAERIKEEIVQELQGGGGRPEERVSDLLREVTQRVYNTLLQSEMDEHLGYGKHEVEGRGSGNSRNGSTKKTVRSDIGEILIETPRDRSGTFEPQAVRKRQTLLDNTSGLILSLYGKGMTTRDIEEHFQELYGMDVSPSLISRVTEQIQNEVTEWQNRPLESLYAVLYLDGIRFSIRQDGAVRKKVVYLVMGITLDGQPDVLGLWIAENEGAKFWLTVCNDLKARGVKDVLIACVDGLKGFPDALESVFPDVDVQLCIVHQVRNALRFVSFKDRRAFCADMKAIYTSPTVQAAEQALATMKENWAKKYPASIASWEDNWDRLTCFYQYPVELRKVIYTTNAIENLNSVLRKNTRNRKIFPSDEALFKLLYLNIKKQTAKWTIRRNWATVANQLVIMFQQRIHAAENNR